MEQAADIVACGPCLKKGLRCSTLAKCAAWPPAGPRGVGEGVGSATTGEGCCAPAALGIALGRNKYIPPGAARKNAGSKRATGTACHRRTVRPCFRSSPSSAPRRTLVQQRHQRRLAGAHGGGGGQGGEVGAGGHPAAVAPEVRGLGPGSGRAGGTCGAGLIAAGWGTAGRLGRLRAVGLPRA